MDAARSLKINSRPLYLQAIEAIKDMISQNRYKAGEMLPPELTLAGELGISRLTLREALGYLENDGFIERRRGVGTFVCEPTRAHFAGGLERLETLRTLAGVAGLCAETVSRQVSLVPAADAWAAALEVPPGSELARVQATQAIDGAIMAYFDSVVLRELVDVDELQAAEGSLLEYFLETGVAGINHSRSTLAAINAASPIAGILGVPEGTAVLRLNEVFYPSSWRPVSVSENYFVTGSFNFYISRHAGARFARGWSG